MNSDNQNNTPSPETDDDNAAPLEDDFDEGFQPKGPSPAVLKKLRALGVGSRGEAKSATSSRKKTRTSKSRSTTSTKKSGSTARPRKKRAVKKTASRKKAKTSKQAQTKTRSAREGFKKRHFRLPLDIDEMLVEMKVEREVTFTQVVLEAINAEYHRWLRRKQRAAKKARG